MYMVRKGMELYAQKRAEILLYFCKCYDHKNKDGYTSGDISRVLKKITREHISKSIQKLSTEGIIGFHNSNNETAWPHYYIKETPVALKKTLQYFYRHPKLYSAFRESPYYIHFAQQYIREQTQQAFRFSIDELRKKSIGNNPSPEMEAVWLQYEQKLLGYFYNSPTFENVITNHGDRLLRFTQHFTGDTMVPTHHLLAVISGSLLIADYLEGRLEGKDECDKEIYDMDVFFTEAITALVISKDGFVISRGKYADAFMDFAKYSWNRERGRKNSLEQKRELLLKEKQRIQEQRRLSKKRALHQDLHSMD